MADRTGKRYRDDWWGRNTPLRAWSDKRSQVLNYNTAMDMAGALTTVKRQHRPALPLNRISELLVRLDGYKGQILTRLLTLLIFIRSSELRFAREPEILHPLLEQLISQGEIVSTVYPFDRTIYVTWPAKDLNSYGKYAATNRDWEKIIRDPNSTESTGPYIDVSDIKARY